jgi:hypothetical protein
LFTRTLHWSISSARWIQSTPNLISPTSILALSTHLHLGFPTDLFPSGVLVSIVYAIVFSPIRATCSPHLILLDLIVLIILGEEYKLCSSQNSLQSCSETPSLQITPVISDTKFLNQFWTEW